MRDTLAPPTRPAAYAVTKARVPLRLTSKSLRPSASSSAIVPHAALAAPQFQPMDGTQVMQALLGMMQNHLQPPPPPNDGISLRFFSIARCAGALAAPGAAPAAAPAAPATPTPAAAPALPAPALPAPEPDADAMAKAIEDLAAGADGNKLPMRRPAAAAAATPSPKKRPAAAAATPQKQKKSKGDGKGARKGKGNGKRKDNGKGWGKGKGTPKKKGQMVLGCSKCRGAGGGCSTCRDPAFGGVRGPR